MKKFIGTKVIMAEPMTLTEAQKVLGREIKPYWLRRITKDADGDYSYIHTDDGKFVALTLGSDFRSPYTHVLFINGYRRDSPRIEKKICGITIGKPKKGMCPDEWLDHEFFIIKFK